jgi:hypothetical protein
MLSAKISQQGLIVDQNSPPEGSSDPLVGAGVAAEGSAAGYASRFI